jgi:putative SOS response-associated peptidase YedK
MCGRYILTAPSHALQRQFDLTNARTLAPRYNIAPTQDAPVVRQRREPGGERLLHSLRWGLVAADAENPHDGAPLINLRAETVLDKPAFRAAFLKRRCLVPADGFYEWPQDGPPRQPRLVTRCDGRLFALAGLWERWTPKEQVADAPRFIDSFAILTTTANALLSPLHDRMPVILPEDAYGRWLDHEAAAAELRALLAPAPEWLLRYVPVGPRVNARREDDGELIEPAGPEVCWSGS